MRRSPGTDCMTGTRVHPSARTSDPAYTAQIRSSCCNGPAGTGKAMTCSMAPSWAGSRCTHHRSHYRLFHPDMLHRLQILKMYLLGSGCNASPGHGARISVQCVMYIDTAAKSKSVGSPCVWHLPGPAQADTGDSCAADQNGQSVVCASNFAMALDIPRPVL